MQSATKAQVATIIDLLRKAEFDTRTITFMFRRIGVDDSWQGQSVDSWLRSLTTESASKVITKLEVMV